MKGKMSLLTEFKPGDYGFIMYEGQILKAKVEDINVYEDGWTYRMEIDTGHGIVLKNYFSRHQSMTQGVYPTKDALLKEWRASYINGEAQVIFGGKIKVDIADHIPTGRICVLFSELKEQHDPGSDISKEESEQIENIGQVVFAFNDRRSVEVVKKALTMVEDEFKKREGYKK